MSELPPERLQAIVDGVSDRFRSTEDHKLVRVRADTDGSPEVSVRTITTSAPEDELLGTTAPASWLAVGARLADTARRGDPSAEDPATSAAARLVGEPVEGELTFLLDRSGNAAGVIRHDGMTRRLDAAPEGFLGDTFRRVLGLPTPPPPADTVER